MGNKILLQEDARLHMLYSLNYSFYVSGRRPHRFFIKVRDEEQTKILTLGKSLDAAYRLYLLLVKNEVAPCHVYDIIADMGEDLSLEKAEIR